MPYKFSPHSLSLLKECPHCFWRHYHEGLRRPEMHFPSLPNGMDRILKNHFDSYLRKEILPPELRGLEGKVKLFEQEDLLKNWRNNYKGVRWMDEEGNTFFGAVDNILQTKESSRLIVLDYKTRGFPLKEKITERYQDQLDIYNLLLRKNN